MLLLLLLTACNPYARWPDKEDAFPWVFRPETDVEDYELVRVETETWTPVVDAEETGQYVTKSWNHKPRASFDVETHFAMHRPTIPPLRGGDGFTVSFVGDVMPVGGHWSDFAVPAAHLLDGDIRVGNLETPTSADHPYDGAGLRDIGLYTLNSPPELLDGLPLDLVQINNNHTIDLGDRGVRNTIRELDARGIFWTGVNEQRVLQLDTQLIAFLAFTWGSNEPVESSDNELFVVPFGHRDAPVDLSLIEAWIDATREAGVQTVVVMVHWGYEYEYFPDPQFMQMGRDIIAMGADAVIGSGPHVAQPVEICAVNIPEIVPGVGTCSVRTADGQPRIGAIVHSLGNFGWNPSLRASGLPTHVGLAVKIRFDPDVAGLEWTPIAGVEEPGQGEQLFPLADLVDDPDHAAEAARLDQHMGTTWKR